MRELSQYIAEEHIMAQLGRFYMEVLWEANNARDLEEYRHGEWLRQALIHKLNQHQRSYN